MSHTGLVDGDLAVIRSRGSAPAPTIMSRRIPLMVATLRMKWDRKADCKSLVGCLLKNASVESHGIVFLQHHLQWELQKLLEFCYDENVY